MHHIVRLSLVCFVCVLAIAPGCATSNHAEEGGVMGGLLGAGTGAIIGKAVGGSPATGALIGAAAGGLGGAALARAKIRRKPKIAQ